MFSFSRRSSAADQGSEAWKRGWTKAPAPAKKRLTVFGKAARRKRIIARLEVGWTYDGIARGEPLTATRVRQIGCENLQKREVETARKTCPCSLSG